MRGYDNCLAAVPFPTYDSCHLLKRVSVFHHRLITQITRNHDETLQAQLLASPTNSRQLREPIYPTQSVCDLNTRLKLEELEKEVAALQQRVEVAQK